MTIIDFARIEEYKLYPVQEFLLKCFYGLELSDNRKIKLRASAGEEFISQISEKDLLDFLFKTGRANTDKTEGKIFKQINWACGRRGGKTYLACLMAQYELKQSDGDVGVFTPRSDMIAGGFKKLRNLSQHESKGNTRIHLIGSDIGKARGRNLSTAIIDEAAFCTNLTQMVNQAKCCVGKKGKIILATSPGNGEFQNEFNRMDNDCFSVSTNTALMNPDISIHQLEEWRNNSGPVFYSEFGGMQINVKKVNS